MFGINVSLANIYLSRVDNRIVQNFSEATLQKQPFSY